MTGPDPLETVWQALELRGYEPRGSASDFRSRCPGHDGENGQALHVVLGADGRVLLHCFRGCEPRAVVEALGLQWRDLFPLGHPFNRRRAKRRPKPRGAIEVVLDGLQLAGIGVRGMWIADRCPYCDAPGLWLYASPGGDVGAECVDGCAREDVLAALETLVAIKEAQHGAR